MTRRRAAIAASLVATLVALLWWWWPTTPTQPGPTPAKVASKPSPATPARWTPTRRPVTPPLLRPVDAPAEEPVAQEDTGDSGDTGTRWGQVEVVAVDEDGNALNDAQIGVRGCEVHTAEDKGAWMQYTALGTCRFTAFRRDGALVVRSQTEVVEVGPDIGRPYIELELPSAPQGGLGVRFQLTDGAIEVLEVVPGTPAEDLGIQAGDFIVEVDGVSTDELDSPWEVVDLLSGDEGTEVEFVLEFEGDTGLVEQAVYLIREHLEG